MPLAPGTQQTNTSGPGQLLTSVFMNNSCGTAASKDHIVSSPGTITDSLTMLYGTFGYATIIEGFGALDFQYLSGTPSTVSTGVGTSSGTVSGGWALAGYGGDSTYTSGPGRMLFRVGANGDARSVIVQSKDHLYVSAGSTTAWWTQVRRTPGSHGLCNQGGVLSAGMDSCVASICTSDSYCCNTSWDAQCVGEVSSICGRSCANYTCGYSSYSPTFWNDGGTVQLHNNCYNYGKNRRTDTFAQVGRASGEEGGTVDVATVTKHAVNDGLISTTLVQGCPEARELIAMVIKPTSPPDWHWYRRDVNNYWTHKPGSSPATNLDNSGHQITSPETADRGAYTVWGGYFCSCSSATQGAGHAVIN